MLDLSYIADISEIDRFMDAHREFLRRRYDAGVFLASGRKEPRTGGIIIAAGRRDNVEQVVAEDPFSVHRVAKYAITEFLPTMTSRELERYRLPR